MSQQRLALLVSLWSEVHVVPPATKYFDFPRSFAYAQCPDQRFHVPSLVFIGAFSRDLLSLALCSPMQGGAARAARTLRFRGRVFDRRASAWGSPGHALCMHSDQPASIILGAFPRSAATWRLQEATSPVPGLAITRLRTGVGGRLRREVWGRSGSNIWGQSPPFSGTVSICIFGRSGSLRSFAHETILVGSGR
jgi:hypothetical protein